MTANQRYRMREAVGLILRADRDVFERVTAEDFAAFECELEGPGVAYFLVELDRKDGAR